MHDFPIIPASKKSIAYRKPILDVGINDADYIVQPIINKKQIYCPFYGKWKSMLERCYSEKYQFRFPSYIGCSICEEWHSFMAFKGWMDKQNWQGKQLDKDILMPRNKVYSPATCIFVDNKINSLLNEYSAGRGEFSKGVSHHKETNKYRARICIDGKIKNLGLYATQGKAALVYRHAKYCEILRHAAMQTDPRIKEGLERHAILLLT